ncbi:UPF0481 protein At3g47200 [Eucalyptus grandis]|uniref:UPF0481 protein At3g47200 n=1 Tax=Eucalyptus grandis TaxID=71139 RepID=UPI00192EAB30|nr:UPF0481 protein At3g47200 [Eucalyptus grandis]
MAGTVPTSASDHHDELVTSISNRLRQLSETSFNCRLLTVLDKLRKNHKEAFLPKQISIGPFYHHGKRWKAMEDHKWRYLQSFLARTQKKLQECVEVLKKLEKRTCLCYLEKIDLNNDEFITMVLVDGAFVIELFLLNHFPEKKAVNDVIFDKKKEWMIMDVRRDMSLMENQLQFFVLENLYNFAFGSQLTVLPSLLELAYDFFISRVNLKAEGARIFDTDVNHLLDALRSWYLPATQDAQGDGWKNVEAIPRPSHLRAAGVKFRISESNCLFDIKFSVGVLYIPCLELFPVTESFLRNITAFKQSYYKHDSYSIEYVAFLENLINTRADAKLLIKKCIIDVENWLGHDGTLAKDAEALANLFNSFGKENRFWTRNINFCSLRQDLKAYYRSHWH